MASIDDIDLNGQKIQLMNVSQPVGPFNGLSDDVMLVKALLNVALGDLGVDDSELPLPTAGTLDAATKKNIKLFQRTINELNQSISNPERLSVDGRVSRARGRFSFDRNRPWTISVLNTHVKLAAERRGFRSALEMVTKVFPLLPRVLDVDDPNAG